MQSANGFAVARACVCALLGLHGLMLAALFTRTLPHPPLDVAAFALGPFLAATVALGLFSAVLLAAGARAGHGAAVVFALASVVSFGPQKFADPEFGRIWPAVLVGLSSAGLLLVVAVNALRARK